MASKYCSGCYSKLPLTSFLQNAYADPASRVYSSCVTCREKTRKRRATAIATPQPPAQRPRTETPGPVYPLFVLLYCTRLIGCRLVALSVPSANLLLLRKPLYRPANRSPILLLLRKPLYLPANLASSLRTSGSLSKTSTAPCGLSKWRIAAAAANGGLRWI